MATLCVRNIPDDLYDALRKQAQQHRRSVSAEVALLLEQLVPTERELRKRRAAIRSLNRLSSIASPSPGPFPSTEEMVREDRSR